MVPAPSLTAQTRLLGVIGWPVGHSLSPPMHGAALAAMGLDWAYAAFPVRPADLPAAVAGARALGLAGLNVTIPHKEAVLALCEPDPLAAAVGAVNTLCFDEDRTRGFNTDVHGFGALCRHAGVEERPRALLLGTGGAARAVVTALHGMGAAVQAAARAPRPLAVGGVAVPVLPLSAGALRPVLPRCDLLVDCTPRGLEPAGAAPPGTDPRYAPTHPEVDLSLLPRHAVVLDLVVRLETPLLRAARAAGLRAEAGAVMLLHQGVAALEIWLGRPVPGRAVAAMQRALTAALTAPPTSAIIPA